VYITIVRSVYITTVRSVYITTVRSVYITTVGGVYITTVRGVYIKVAYNWLYRLFCTVNSILHPGMLYYTRTQYVTSLILDIIVM